MFDDSINGVLQEYNQRYHQEFDELLPSLEKDEIPNHRDKLLMSIGHNAGLFLNIFIKESNAKKLVEFGTSYGHSTIYLAEAAKHNKGKVWTCDTSAEKQDYAQQMLKKANLLEYVEFLNCDSLDACNKVPDNVDFCLIDLWNEAYIRTFNAVFDQITAGGFIVSDNMTVPDEDAGNAYRQHIKTFPLESVLVPIGWGLDIARKLS